MSELAYNLLWSWDHNLRALFRRLDPALWKACGNNPVLMLGRVPQARSNAPPTIRDTCRSIAAHASATTATCRPRRARRRQTDRLLLDGVRPHRVPADLLRRSGAALSGDHLKASSDADLPLIAVGLLYQKGYHQQWLNPDGWQQERYPINDFYTLPVEAGATMQAATTCWST